MLIHTHTHTHMHHVWYLYGTASGDTLSKSNSAMWLREAFQEGGGWPILEIWKNKDIDFALNHERIPEILA